nr:efflux RND transporter permease subunit [Vibrio gelatinilyticus]
MTITAFAAWYGQTHFKMNADLSSLVKQEGPWVEHMESLEKAFPDSSNVTVLVSSSDGQRAKVATKILYQKFSQLTLFKDVFAPSTLGWFEQHPLGFIADSDFKLLENAVRDQLAPAVTAAKAQSIEVYLGALAQNKTLTKSALKPLESAFSGHTVNWWQDLENPIHAPNAYVISLLAKPNDSVNEPNRAIIESVNQIIREANLPSSVKVLVTGQAALDFDEIADANSSIAIAGSASLIGLVLILAIGIRSVRVIAACYLTVVVGLIWTFAAGLLVIGHFNTISIVFMVMFIGLAVDFAIHLCLHIQELRLQDRDNRASVVDAVRHSVRPLSLCAISSAIGFLSFYPTAYTGLGELGVVSALGMILGLIATFTVIPLFFGVVGYPRVRHTPNTSQFQCFGSLILRHRKAIVAIACLMAGVTGYGASQFKFDFSTLVLKNPESSSMAGLKALQSEGLGSSYQLYAIAKTRKQAEQWKSRISQSDSVERVVIASDFLPMDPSQRKRDLAKQLTAIEEPLVHDALNLPRLSWEEFRRKAVSDIGLYAERLPTSIDKEQLSHNLFSGLPALTKQLTAGPDTEKVTIEALPALISERYISETGQWLVAVVPSGDMTRVDELNQFISDVHKVAPKATGRAIAEKEVGVIVVEAFKAAILMSVMAIALILIWTVEKKRDVVLIFIPLILATLVTLGIMHWMNLSLNMANIIVIPLIFGLGVDNGIHIVKRFRAVGHLTEFFKTSTPKASLISCLTTLATFGALIVAQHQGMHSIGVVLTVALSSILLFSLVLLPIMLEMTKKAIR